MAEFVLGVGTSHGPTMSTPWEKWLVLGEKDPHDERLNPSALVIKPALAAEISDERRAARDKACHAAIAALTARIAEARPDTILVISNPHKIYPQEPQPVFGIYLGDSMPVSEDGDAGSGERRFNRKQGIAPRRYPADPELAIHLMASLMADGFDLASYDRFRDGTLLEHAYSIMYEHYLAKPLPLVPFIVSRYLPNQASPARCYALGRALRKAIDSWQSDKRVMVVASGGLSHQIIDEELDRSVIAALQRKDVAGLIDISSERLNAAPGTPEILNWITLGGVAEDKPMTLLDYLPCYRSLLGTGQGLTFAYWAS
jgi:aromatic ring-opening dioxygenase catalytic subunit (LigB family)